MNLQSDNQHSQSNSTLAKLKQSTQSTIHVVTETPYQPIVYAIPKEHLQAIVEFMKSTANFFPEMYEKFEHLESQVLTQDQWSLIWNELEELTDSLSFDVRKTTRSIVQEVRYLLEQNKEFLLQDGKQREQFSYQISNELVNQYKMISQMKKRITIMMLGTALISVLTAVVVCLLLTK